MTNTIQPLYLERLEHEEPNPAPHSSAPSNFYKATANQDLWQENSVTRAGIILERVISGTGIAIDYEVRRELTVFTDLWLIRFMKPEHGGQLLEKDEINGLLANDTPPSVRMTQSAEYPSLLLAYRATPVGRFALAALEALPEIERASPVHAQAGTGLYTMYPQGALTAVLVNPAAEMGQAEEAVHNILTV